MLWRNCWFFREFGRRPTGRTAKDLYKKDAQFLWNRDFRLREGCSAEGTSPKNFRDFFFHICSLYYVKLLFFLFHFRFTCFVSVLDSNIKFSLFFVIPIAYEAFQILLWSFYQRPSPSRRHTRLHTHVASPSPAEGEPGREGRRQRQ